MEKCGECGRPYEKILDYPAVIFTDFRELKIRPVVSECDHSTFSTFYHPKHIPPHRENAKPVDSKILKGFRNPKTYTCATGRRIPYVLDGDYLYTREGFEFTRKGNLAGVVVQIQQDEKVQAYFDRFRDLIETRVPRETVRRLLHIPRLEDYLSRNFRPQGDINLVPVINQNEKLTLGLVISGGKDFWPGSERHVGIAQLEYEGLKN